jgi:hypothetical protein
MDITHYIENSKIKLAEDWNMKQIFNKTKEMIE